jgi:hypothetical protein
MLRQVGYDALFAAPAVRLESSSLSSSAFDFEDLECDGWYFNLARKSC